MTAAKSLSRLCNRSNERHKNISTTINIWPLPSCSSASVLLDAAGQYCAAEYVQKTQYP